MEGLATLGSLGVFVSPREAHTNPLDESARPSLTYLPAFTCMPYFEPGRETRPGNVHVQFIGMNNATATAAFQSSKSASGLSPGYEYNKYQELRPPGGPPSDLPVTCRGPVSGFSGSVLNLEAGLLALALAQLETKPGGNRKTDLDVFMFV